MKTYHKIQTVFKRDPETKFKTLLNGQYSLPIFGLLADLEWTFTEKVDGTNIRVMFDHGTLEFRGKTDAAHLPKPLDSRLEELFTSAKLAEIFGTESEVCLYGEGYGAKIQKVGVNYRSDQDFVLFDVKIGGIWLERENVVDIAGKLGIDVVPVIGSGTLHEMVVRCRKGFCRI